MSARAAGRAEVFITPSLLACRNGAALGTLDDRDPDGVAPLGPGTVVVAHGVEAQQVLEREPGVAGPLADAAVGHDVVALLEPGFVQVQGLQLGAAAVGAVLRRRTGPRDGRRGGNVAAAQGALFRVGRHVRALAGVFLGGAEERRVGKECRSRWSPYH